MSKKKDCDIVLPRFSMTRNNWGDSIQVWLLYDGPLKKIKGVWYQHSNYTSTALFIIHKRVFKRLFGYTLRHGAKAETGRFI